MIGRVDAIRAANATTSAPFADQIRPRIADEFVAGIGEVLVNAASAKSKAESDQVLALQTLGVDAPAGAESGSTAPATPAP